MFDFETGGEIVKKDGYLDASRTIPIQVACIALDARKLNIIPGSEFVTMMRPPEGSVLQQKALDCNKKTEKEIWECPVDWQTAWKRFGDHVKRYNPSKTSTFKAPIAAGKNLSFDLPIAQWMCKKFGPVDKNGCQMLFNGWMTLDLDHLLWQWFEDSNELPSLKMDDVREHFGLSKDGAHDALVDVRQTATLIQKFLRMYRGLHPKVKFKDCCKV